MDPVLSAKQGDPRCEHLSDPTPTVGEGFWGAVRREQGYSCSWTIPNEHENGEKLLGGNRRPEQTEMLENMQLAPSHLLTCQQGAILDETLPRRRQPFSWVRFRLRR